MLDKELLYLGSVVGNSRNNLVGKGGIKGKLSIRKKMKGGNKHTKKNVRRGKISSERVYRNNQTRGRRIMWSKLLSK